MYVEALRDDGEVMEAHRALVTSVAVVEPNIGASAGGDRGCLGASRSTVCGSHV